MIHLIRLGFVFFVFLLCFPQGQAQNIFNEENSLEYATYLYKSEQYQLASEEYERLVFLDVNNTQYQIALLKSLYKLEAYDYAFKRVHSLSGGDMLSLSEDIYELHTLGYVQAGMSEQALTLINKRGTIQSKEFQELKTTAYIMNGQLEIAKLYVNDINWGEASRHFYVEQIESFMKIKKKSPILAATMSTVIPGSGKIYSGDWKDGLFSFAMITVLAWESYRGFNKNGVKSFQGWFAGGLGIGFHLGNIAGSFRAAELRNRKNKDRIHQQLIERQNANYNF